MSDAVQLPLVAPPHRNQQLFSDPYLNTILPARADWQALDIEARAVLADIARIYADYQPSRVEAQVEEGLIKPVLRALGHSFEVQPALKTPDGTKRPDYVFYQNAAELGANKDRTLDDALPKQGGIAVGDAKAWDRSLDQSLKGGGDPFSNKNPGYQISFYIQHSGVSWGILTNGRLWRLYHKATAHKLDHYYEIDLPALLQTADHGRFLYFYAFFARRAFDEGPLGLEAILSSSADYARQVSDTLKEQVYDALRHVAQGFLDYRQNNLKAEPETLKQIYDASLILLYRLLFVLYAEDRELLPVHANGQYRDSYSLRKLKLDVAQGRTLRPNTAIQWSRLSALFGIIDGGDKELGVATYNGGLFDPEKHPFLEEYAVGDRHLQEAIDKLARVDVVGADGKVRREFVDYRDLAVRHLGTIYEGLLEYHLEPSADGEWSVALLNDKGERKATGSYYTPDYIVKYMVDRTLGPVLDVAVAGQGDDAARAAAVLKLNVLDPAMGSGHFLVEATEYIARRLVELDVRPGGVEAEAADIDYWKRRVAQSCIYGVDLNPLSVELAKLSLWLATVSRDRPLSFLDHHLRAGNSLVGARLADLRLDSKASGKKKAGASDKQFSMLDVAGFGTALRVAVDSMWLIEETPGQTIKQVKTQEELFHNLRQELSIKYGRLADVVVAQRFGLQLDLAAPEQAAFIDHVTGWLETDAPHFNAWIKDAIDIARKYRFFHWELEFPEVFFDRRGDPLGDAAGFDAVLGNPPYVRQEALAPFKPYFAKAFEATYNGIADLYVYFFQHGLMLMRSGGRMSYITTNKWMRAGYGEPLRAYFADERVLHQLIDFGHAPIFPDADVFPAIVVLDKTRYETDLESSVSVTTFPREELQKTSLEQYIRDHSIQLARHRFSREAWNLEPSSIDDLMAKMRVVGIPLTEFVGTRPVVGIKTGFNEAYLIPTTLKQHLVQAHPDLTFHIKPYLRGRDIKRWSSSWEGLWIILLKSSSDYSWPWSKLQPEEAEKSFETTYPILFEHMAKWKTELQQRTDHGRFWWELRACAYYDAFDSENTFYQDLAFHSRFCLAPAGTVAEMTCFCLRSTGRWVLAVLNSPLMWAYMWRNVVHGKDEVLRLKTIYMEDLPIAPPSDEIRNEAEPAVERLIAITEATQRGRSDTLDWLRMEFGIETPGQRLEDFAALDSDSFIEEVRKRRPRSAGPLTPAVLRALRAGYTEQATPIQELQREAARLERRLGELVNQAYGLTPEEVALLWESAPPRMPRF